MLLISCRFTIEEVIHNYQVISSIICYIFYSCCQYPITARDFYTGHFCIFKLYAQKREVAAGRMHRRLEYSKTGITTEILNSCNISLVHTGEYNTKAFYK